ncbi:MAG TPA: hypothetical protein DCZ03_09050 [Gammaproteobacteria bacterium]|nr:hypothetical protein [Gammaproteobacteria bacterium]
MNRKMLIASAVAQAVLGSTAALAAPFEFYGKGLLTLEQISTEDEIIVVPSTGTDTFEEGSDVWEVKSNASRIGVKGDMEVADGMATAFYKFEWEVDVTDGDSDGDNFKSRNHVVGLKSDYGKVFLGQYDTPLKKAQGKIDLFNDLFADIKNVIVSENRLSNTLSYQSPSMGGVKANIMLIQGEEGDTVTIDSTGTQTDSTSGDGGIGDGVSASVTYENDQLFAALAMDDEVKGVDSLRLVLQGRLGGAKVGLLYQDSEPSDGSADSEDGYVLSASYKIGKFTPKIQFAASDQKALGREQLTLGVDKKMGDQTKLLAFISDRSEDDDSQDETSVGFGIEHKFSSL